MASLHSPISPSSPSKLPNGSAHRPSAPRHATAPSLAMNGHFAPVRDSAGNIHFDHGIQVIDEDKEFNEHLNAYLQHEAIIPAGFNYHLISVFGSQSTGKSTLLNYLFGTDFGVMSEQDRRQTTKGIWMSKNKRQEVSSPRKDSQKLRMADNILVMDVEGTDGRERGEDQDFERKSALFALATSEVLIVNIWEHQVGLYQGANMGLLKTVFEVNLQLFVKDSKSIPRSLLFFVIRDHLGTTPLSNLRQTLMSDLSRIWSSLSKPQGLESSSITDYFDFAFVALPHKILQPEKFAAEVQELSIRFREGDFKTAASRKNSSILGIEDDPDAPVLRPEYHRRIPADGFSVYAKGIWDQIESNKDLDLPTQQELLAQFRCDEIAREALIPFDAAVAPLEARHAEATSRGVPIIVDALGQTINAARSTALEAFEAEAGRYHKGVFGRKRTELEEKIDDRLKSLWRSQIGAAQKVGVADFSEAVSTAVKNGQKKAGGQYDFAKIVEAEKMKAIKRFADVAQEAEIKDAKWSGFDQELSLFKKELDEVSKRLRREEMRRLATRVERWVRSKLGESVGLEFNKLGSGRGGSGAPEEGEREDEKDIWDRVWLVFTDTVTHAEERFTDRARSFDASPEEVEVGLWRLRRKSWGALRAKLDEELMEGNLLLKLRENFEDRFRYDNEGVPRIWRPTDDIEGIYTVARQATLQLIPLLSKFKLRETGSSPPLEAWIGEAPSSVTPADEEDLAPIGGVDEDEGKSLEEEMTVLSDAKAQDLSTRFKKMADGVYVEAKRGAIGGITQVPLYFYGLLLALGWNELWAVLRNPVYFILIILLGVGAYVTYTLNLWGPMLRMTNAASAQALEIGKEKLREFLQETETGRQAMAMSAGKDGSAYKMDTLNREGKKKIDEDEDDEI
ncbi:MAG: Dynamin-like GTPase that mediates homotypic ER fusion [Bogoriella megaspora]|nr:MAG: Dynamin-like GTPase that mediates homotypic ER fusion [Bogoriella megaspora]